MELWVALTFGRFLVPRAVVFEGHRLVTSGPYRLLRHPDYSAILALWLGAARYRPPSLMLCGCAPLAARREDRRLCGTRSGSRSFGPKQRNCCHRGRALHQREKPKCRREAEAKRFAEDQAS